MKKKVKRTTKSWTRPGQYKESYLVPCFVKAGTVLYHCTGENEIDDWAATLTCFVREPKFYDLTGDVWKIVVPEDVEGIHDPEGLEVRIELKEGWEMEKIGTCVCTKFPDYALPFFKRCTEKEIRLHDGSVIEYKF